MNRTRIAAFTLAAALVLAAAFAEPVPAANQPCGPALKSENVVMVLVDGLRWQEVFSGADESLMNKESGGVEDVDALRKAYWRDTPEARREALLPFIWTTVAKDGQIFGNQTKGSIVRLTNPHRFSYPGYSEMLVGFADPRVDSNDKRPNPNPTVLEWLNSRPGFRGRVAAFGMWDVLPYILDRERSGLFVSAGLEPVPDAPADSALGLLNRLKAEVPPRWSGQAFDALMFNSAIEYLKRVKPRVLLITFGETDEWAHEGRYADYLDAAHRTDAFIKKLWDVLREVPEYKDKTTLILVTDHGRGNGPEEWKSHGAKIEGAQNVWIGVIGPDWTGRGEAGESEPLVLAQVAATLAAAVGEDYAAATPAAARAIDPAPLVQAAAAPKRGDFRPPAVPLVTHDPYFSVWSFNDRLTDGWTTHWTGRTQPLVGMIWIDGRPYRFAGPEPNRVPAMQQCGVEVRPTETIYEFCTPELRLTVSFVSPLLPDDIDLLSRPITYVTAEAWSNDGAAHQAKLYLDCSAEWAVNSTNQPVRWSRAKSAGLHVLSFGTKDQKMLERVGDDVRIDWGHFYLALPVTEATSAVIARDKDAREHFADTGELVDSDDLRQPRPARDDWPVAACTADLGAVEDCGASITMYVGYDDLYSLEYFGRPVRPYWRRGGQEFGDVLAAAVKDQAAILRRCREFDAELLADLRAVGGEKYARLAALAYRQTIAAHKVVADFDGTMLMFPKENFSNGCIGTVDVFFPSSPLFLLLSPRLMEAQVRPVLEYASTLRWKFPFAPHDLGTYPQANGQVYGGAEKTEDNQMPVEESANLVILAGALGELDGKAALASEYWSVITRWAEYLRDHGLDPNNQLCTDDFAGHLAHNANLSIKAILALGAYARMCELTGRDEVAAEYRRIAEGYVAEWMKLADDGDHYRLAFDQPGTWSQKYNLLWDRVLKSPLFPPDVTEREVACYLTKCNRFGVPLDGRETYAKLDFNGWVAALTKNRADFDALVEPLYDFAGATPDRVPLTDWYRTTDGTCVGFRARSVVGGLYAPMLVNPELRQKWSSRGR